MTRPSGRPRPRARPRPTLAAERWPSLSTRDDAVAGEPSRVCAPCRASPASTTLSAWSCAPSASSRPPSRRATCGPEPTALQLESPKRTPVAAAAPGPVAPERSTASRTPIGALALRRRGSSALGLATTWSTRCAPTGDGWTVPEPGGGDAVPVAAGEVECRLAATGRQVVISKVVEVCPLTPPEMRLWEDTAESDPEPADGGRDRRRISPTAGPSSSRSQRRRANSAVIQVSRPVELRWRRPRHPPRPARRTPTRHDVPDPPPDRRAPSRRRQPSSFRARRRAPRRRRPRPPPRSCAHRGRVRRGDNRPPPASPSDDPPLGRPVAERHASGDPERRPTLPRRLGNTVSTVRVPDPSRSPAVSSSGSPGDSGRPAFAFTARPATGAGPRGLRLAPVDFMRSPVTDDHGRSSPTGSATGPRQPVSSTTRSAPHVRPGSVARRTGLVRHVIRRR